MKCRVNKDSGCGHDHSHDDHDHTSCGHDHSHHEHHDHNCGCTPKDIVLNAKETAMLKKLSEAKSLELVRFALKSTKSPHFESVALAPVYMPDGDATIEAVRETGKILKTLEEYGLIFLDYEQRLENGDYSVYENSKLYKGFLNTVEEAKSKEGFIFDIPVLDCGSIIVRD